MMVVSSSYWAVDSRPPCGKQGVIMSATDEKACWLSLYIMCFLMRRPRDRKFGFCPDKSHKGGSRSPVGVLVYYVY